MRIALTSRIFEPEPSAASFRLAALASAFREAGHEVVVFTVKPPTRLESDSRDSTRQYQVRRWPVLRDSSGYVRGYIQYLSFDVPMFFRVLFGGKFDYIVSEPPPTTGFFVRIVSWLKRAPYGYYAADVWSDASVQAGAPGFVISVVRGVENWVLRGAKTVLSVSDGVTQRLAELGVSRNVVTIGNGINTASFGSFEEVERQNSAADSCEFVYAGTASEWHGAEIFVQALPLVRERFPNATIQFIGGGSQLAALAALAEQLEVAEAISFTPVMAAEELAPILRTSVASLASVRPGTGYDFAFPTKLYSGAMCGAPLLYAGIGPGADFTKSIVGGAPLGVAVSFSAEEVAEAMLHFLEHQVTAPRRAEVSKWAAEHVSLTGVAAKAVAAITAK